VSDLDNDEHVEIARAREVRKRFRTPWLVLFGVFGFVFGVAEPFVLLNQPEHIHRILSGLLGAGIGYLVGQLIRLIHGLHTP